MSSAKRLLAVAVGLSLVLTGAGLASVSWWFGWNNTTSATRLEDRIRRQFNEQRAEVDSLASRVAAEGAAIAEALASRDRVPRLFDRLAQLAPADARIPVTATIYVPGPSVNSYRVLAWSAGPAEDIARERLAGGPAIFLARGTSGIRLVALRPVETGGRRVAVVTAELILASMDAGGQAALETSFGPVTLLVPPFAGASEEPPGTSGFVIESDTGGALLEARIANVDLASRRRSSLRHVLAAGALPLAAVGGLAVSLALGRRRRARDGPAWWLMTVVAVTTLAGTAAMVVVLSRLLDASPSLTDLEVSAGGLMAVTVVVGGWWWRPVRRARPTAAPVRFALEQIAAGGMLAAVILVLTRLLETRITVSAIDHWQSALFPFDPAGLLEIAGSLVATMALTWMAAAAVATAAGRWRLQPFGWPAVAACSAWTLPALAMAFARQDASLSREGAAVFVLAIAGFGFAATNLRRAYRRTTQSTRLLFELLAVLTPLVVIYPLTAWTLDRTTRTVIERDYAPGVARHPEELRAELARAQDSIDRYAPLRDLVVGSHVQPDSHPAFLVWSQTNLSRSRVISDVELYGADRALVSRFALNLPEYVYRAGALVWTGAGCNWEVFGEVTPFGADNRRMLHAERGLCDNAGTLVGAVVVHVARDDYEALPFVSSSNPYYEVLGVGSTAPPTPRLPDLQVAVYGWSFQPLFTSGRVAWPITEDIFDRVYRTGAPFWTTLSAQDRTYHVQFSQNRDGIYALGYPTPTLFDHATRMVEIVAIGVVCFLLMQIGAAVYAPLIRRSEIPLRALFLEIRTSFYRKLFLFFVFVAVGPVLVFALVFNAYMTSKFRADVESEASSVVTVARRVFEELSAAEQRGTRQPSAPSDDVMVWIRQVIDQDVNLFDGAELVATSQRDLFDSGLLPTRTPASVYQGIALERLPTVVAEDRLGDNQYVVAAAPVVARGQELILSVPLANRQREIQREIDELNRGVLAGSLFVVLLAAGLGAQIAGRVADPVSRLTRATRQIAAGRLDVRVATDTADELRRLVDDFNSMAETLGRQRTELARANQLKAWNEMARQVAHEIKNPLTPIQLAAEHLQRVHEDRGRPLGEVLDQCLRTILTQVRLLRQIASEFANFAGAHVARLEPIALATLVESVLAPYRVGLGSRVQITARIAADLPDVSADRTLLSRALTNLVENAVQAMPDGGALAVEGFARQDAVELVLRDTGVGMDATALERAFEPYFSTKTAGSGLGLANARRNIELSGGVITLTSAAGQGTTVTVRLRAARRPGEDADGREAAR